MYFLPFSTLYFAVMNVFSIVRLRLPLSVEPCPFASDINSLTLIKAFSTRPYSTVVALNPVPSPMLLPLRESRDPELAIVFAPSFTSFSLVVTFGIDDTICVCCFNFLTNASTSS